MEKLTLKRLMYYIRENRPFSVFLINGKYFLKNGILSSLNDCYLCQYYGGYNPKGTSTKQLKETVQNILEEILS